jgi:hypothetical protein
LAFAPETFEGKRAKRVASAPFALEDANAEAPQFSIETRRKDPVAIMDQELVRMVKGEKLAELLEGPVGGRMRRDVGVQNPARLNFHRDEYIQNPESRSDRYEEITGNQTFCVVAYECGPSQAG